MKSTLFLLILLFSASTLLASANATFEVKTKIIGSISLLKDNDLLFSDITANAGVQNVTVQPKIGDPNGTPAKFVVSGTAGAVVDCSITGPVVPLISGANTMPIGTWRLGNGSDAGTILFSPTLTGGFADVYIGATLTVGVWQANGEYSAQQTLTVSYQ